MQTYDENLLRDTLEFIRKYQEVEGRSPSYRAICHGVNGFTSLAKVHRYINVLDERGLIEKTQNIGIEIFLPQKNKVILRAANSSVDENGERVYKDIETKNCEILGVVVGYLGKI